MAAPKSKLATDSDPDDECSKCGTELNDNGRCEQCDEEPQPLDFG